MIAAETDVRKPAEVPEKWFVAIVKNNTEKISARKLTDAGYEVFAAVQPEVRVRANGRRVKVDRVVISSVVFIHCTEAERRRVVAHPCISRFMMDRASTPSVTGSRVAVIPDKQIRMLQFMLGNSDEPVTMSSHYVKGDRVRVVRGSLVGLEGEVADFNQPRSELTVHIDIFGYAKLQIDTINVEKIQSAPSS